MSNHVKIDDCLSIREGRLYMEECDTVSLVEKYGSPLYLISENQLRRNFRRYRDAFSEWWTDGPVDVLPALKANWTLATRKILNEEGAGADIYSEGELYAALKTGVNPDLISVNGGGKSEEYIKKCVKAGVRITVEDIDEPDLIEKAATELRKTAKIRFRVKPDFPNLWKRTDFAQEFTSIDLGIQVYKSGIPAQYLEELGKKVLKMKYVDLTGLHFHGGRHHASLWFWRGMMKRYARLTADLCKAWGGYKLKEFDIGGGFASPRDPHNKMKLNSEIVLTWFTWPLQLLMYLLPSGIRYSLSSLMVRAGMVRKPNTRRAPSIEEYAETVVKTLKGEFKKLNFDISGMRLQLEPGRALYGDSGIHLARVKKVKRQTKPMKLTWVLTDTTYFFLSGGVLEYNLHDFLVANKALEKPAGIVDIVGHSCFADRILPFVKAPAVEQGDIIAFFDTGAYQEGTASNFNALPRPATVLVSGARSGVVKRAETIKDVFSRDVEPKLK